VTRAHRADRSRRSTARPAAMMATTARCSRVSARPARARSPPRSVHRPGVEHRGGPQRREGRCRHLGQRRVGELHVPRPGVQHHQRGDGSPGPRVAPAVGEDVVQGARRHHQREQSHRADHLEAVAVPPAPAVDQDDLGPYGLEEARSHRHEHQGRRRRRPQRTVELVQAPHARSARGRKALAPRILPTPGSARALDSSASRPVPVDQGAPA
jgi:hypothetical protein